MHEGVRLSSDTGPAAKERRMTALRRLALVVGLFALTLVVLVLAAGGLIAAGVSPPAATIAFEVAVATGILLALIVWRVRVGHRREALLRKLADR